MSNLTLHLFTSLLLCTTAAAQDWLPMGHDGFGNQASASVTRIVQFGGESHYYVGTVEMDGGGRLLHSSDSGWHWSPATANGFGNPDNSGIFLGAVFNATAEDAMRARCANGARRAFFRSCAVAEHPCGALGDEFVA